MVRPILACFAALSLTALAWQHQDGKLAEPKVVTPGATTAEPPSDAVVLFSGADLSAWQHPDGSAPGWKVDGGVITVTTKPLITKRKFADCQLHLEFATPAKVEGDGQGRGNSGVYFQGRYEVQILDSFQNPTYPDGQCGSIYKQHAPLVNSSRKPGEWQTYDIIFRAPRFDAAGKKTANATLTVFHNGVLIQDHAEVTGPTGSAMNANENAEGPIFLQDHGNPMRFRNIWVRPL